MRTITAISSLALAMIMLTAGCDDSNPVSMDTNVPKLDGGADVWVPDLPQPDSFVTPDVAPDQDQAIVDSYPFPDYGPGGDRDYVVSRLILPDAVTASTLGVDYNNDGLVDNALGSILGAVAAMAGNVDLQQNMDDSVNSGATLQLLRLHAISWFTDPTAKAHTWTGAPQQCCTNPLNSTQCATEAQQTCFSGTHTFSPDTNDPAGTVLPGTIAGGQMDFGPTTVVFKLPLMGTNVLELTLKAAHILGTMKGGTITDGIIAGAIPQSELQNKVIPTVAQLLNDMLVDPSIDTTTKATILSIFDTDNDNVISAQELANNSLIKTFLAGDVDVDNDGSYELSLGLGFEVATAVITPAVIPPG